MYFFLAGMRFISIDVGRRFCIYRDAVMWFNNLGLAMNFIPINKFKFIYLFVSS